jgi:asparagine synthetase B (glutamine-hydrolysing)
MNLIDYNEEGYLLNGWYSNVEDVKCKFNKSGYYRFNSDGDCNILIDSIEYIGIDCYVDDKKLDLDNGDWLSDSEEVYCVDEMEYINIKI